MSLTVQVVNSEWMSFKEMSYCRDLFEQRQAVHLELKPNICMETGGV